MGSIFSLLIITPTKRIKYDDVSSITLSTTEGEVTILKNHLPMIANIDITPLKIVREDKEEIYALAVGVLKIDKDFQVTIIVDTFERREDIDISRAEQKKIEWELAEVEKNIFGNQAKRDSLDSIAAAKEEATGKVKKSRSRRSGNTSTVRKTRRSSGSATSSSGGSARVSVRRERH